MNKEQIVICNVTDDVVDNPKERVTLPCKGDWMPSELCNDCQYVVIRETRLLVVWRQRRELHEEEL